MVKKGLIVPPGGGSILSMAPGRSAALKLLGRETGDSIMLLGKPPRQGPRRHSIFTAIATRWRTY
jgi:hypothetical protein